MCNNFLQLRIVIISPYKSQCTALYSELNKNSIQNVEIHTIDSFQGQESEAIIISLVRSNPGAEIGFLTDYRRMNVAMTRAKERLYIIGDSATIGQDAFYGKFLEFIEEIGGYKSAWEMM
jgi:superfamily I DNA and/or RNA helicase